MYVVLRLEAIGDDEDHAARQWTPLLRAAGVGHIERYLRAPSSRPWVAEIAGRDGRYGLRRVFLDPKRDYAEANGRGSRGVYLTFFLLDGGVYEVFERVSWQRSRRYFVRVSDGQLTEIGKEEATAWISGI